MGTHEENKLLGRLRRRGEDNIKIDLRKVGCDAGNWMKLAQDGEQCRRSLPPRIKTNI